MRHSTYKTFFAAVALFVFSGCAFAQTVVSIQPTSSTVSPGGITTLDVDVSNVSNLYSFQFDVTFGASTVAVISETEGGFLATGGTTFFIPGTIDNVGGSVTSTADTLIGSVPGVNGSGTLVVLDFTGLALGTTSIDLANVILLNSSFNSIGFTTQDANLTVGSSVTPEPSSWLLMATGLIAVIKTTHAKRRRMSA
jgi:hypothetical protein